MLPVLLQGRNPLSLFPEKEIPNKIAVKERPLSMFPFSELLQRSDGNIK
jgi:hypothetical protein